MKNNLISLFLFIIFLAGPSGVSAQKIIENLKEPMPEVELVPEDEFQAQTKLYSEVPFNDKYLAYELRLPTDWEETRSGGAGGHEVSSVVLGELSVFHGPPNPLYRSFFKVQALSLKYKQTAEQWIIQFALDRGVPIEGLEVVNENRVEILYVQVEKDMPYVVRTAAIMNGKRVILASYYMPNDFWYEEKSQQASVLKSFNLINKKEEFVEEMLEHKFLDISSFKYPASWELRARPARSIDRLEASLFNVSTDDIDTGQSFNPTLNGKIEVHLVSSYVFESLETEIEKFTDNVVETDLYVGEEIEKIADTSFFPPDIGFGQLTVFNANDNNNMLLNYEYWLAVFSIEDYYYFVTLLTPHRDDDFKAWARNTEAFKLVLSQIRYDVLHEGFYEE